jgi:hypothetical protein
MKGRLFNALGSDLNGLIMRNLNGIDQSLCRVVCKNWAAIIPPQRPTFEKDFRKMPKKHDRKEYMDEVERCIVFPSTLVVCWKDAKKCHFVNAEMFVYTLMFYYRKTDQIPSFALLAKSCLPRDYDTVLLSLVLTVRKNRDEMFWLAIQYGAKETLQWMFNKNMLYMSREYLSSGGYVKAYQFSEKTFELFQWMYDTQTMPPAFWIEYSDMLWKVGVDVPKLVKFAKICQYLPEEACSKVSPEEHKQLLDMCGCEPVVIYKKKQKVV